MMQRFVRLALTFAAMMPLLCWGRIGTTTTTSSSSVMYPLKQRRTPESTTPKLTLEEMQNLTNTLSDDSDPKFLQLFYLQLFETSGEYLEEEPSQTTIGMALTEFLTTELEAVYGPIIHQIHVIKVCFPEQTTIGSSESSNSGRRVLDEESSSSSQVGTQLLTSLNVTFDHEPSPNVQEIDLWMESIMADLTYFVSNLTMFAQERQDEALYGVTTAVRKPYTENPVNGDDDDPDNYNPIIDDKGKSSTSSSNDAWRWILPTVIGGFVLVSGAALLSLRRHRQSRNNRALAKNANTIGGNHVYLDEDSVFSFEATLIDNSPITTADAAAASAIARKSSKGGGGGSTIQARSLQTGTMATAGADAESDIFSGLCMEPSSSTAVASPRNSEARSVFSFLSGFTMGSASTVPISNTTKTKNAKNAANANANNLSSSSPAISPSPRGLLGATAATAVMQGPDTPHSRMSSLFAFSEEESEDLIDSDDDDNDNENPAKTTTSPETDESIPFDEKMSPEQDNNNNNNNDLPPQLQSLSSDSTTEVAVIATIALDDSAAAVVAGAAETSTSEVSTNNNNPNVTTTSGYDASISGAEEGLSLSTMSVLEPLALDTSTTTTAAATMAAADNNTSTSATVGAAAEAEANNSSSMLKDDVAAGAAANTSSATAEKETSDNNNNNNNTTTLSENVAAANDTSGETEKTGLWLAGAAALGGLASAMARRSKLFRKSSSKNKRVPMSPSSDTEGRKKSKKNDDGYSSDPGPTALVAAAALRSSKNKNIPSEVNLSSSDDPKEKIPAEVDAASTTSSNHQGGGRRHAKSTKHDGTQKYQSETMEPLDWSLTSNGTSASEPDLNDSNLRQSMSSMTKSLRIKEVVAGHNAAGGGGISSLAPTSDTPRSTATSQSGISALSSNSEESDSIFDGTSSKSPSKQLISDLVWLEKKISGTSSAAVKNNQDSNSNINATTKADNIAETATTGARQAIEQSDSLSFASGDNDDLLVSLSRSSNEQSGDDKSKKGILSIVCRDCYAPPGKLKIVIHSTKDGPAVHTVKKGSSLEGHIFPGDLIISVDNVDTRSYTAEQVMKMMTNKSRFERKITVLHFENAPEKNPKEEG